MTLVIKNYCGEKPYFLSKGVALEILQDIDRNPAQIFDVVDCDEVTIAMPSGAALLITGFVRRFGADRVEALSFENVVPDVAAQLESAFESASA